MGALRGRWGQRIIEQIMNTTPADRGLLDAKGKEAQRKILEAQDQEGWDDALHYYPTRDEERTIRAYTKGRIQAGIAFDVDFIRQNEGENREIITRFLIRKERYDRIVELIQDGYDDSAIIDTIWREEL